MQEQLHSPIGASSMYRWKNCPGSVSFCKGLKSPESPYAKEGTLAHELAAKILNGFDPNRADDLEMLSAVSVYTDAVFQDKRELDFTYNGNLFLVEHGFKLTQIHPQAFGTADCVIYNFKKKHLIVYDYKHGAGIAVDVEQNDQLLYYALGVMLSLDIKPKTVELKIVQPRCPHEDGQIRSYKFEALHILDFYSDLELAVARTQKPDAKLNAGSWCRFCPGAGICPEIKNSSQLTAKQVFAPTLPYDPKDLGETLKKLPQMEAFIESVRQFAYREALHGRTPPGWKLVQKRATRKWSDLATLHVPALVGAKGFDPPKLKTPAQIEKLLDKEKFAELLPFITAESSGMKLAREDEPGEPIKLDAKSIFETITE